MEKVGIILTPNFRALAYLQRLIQNGFYPNFALILQGEYLEEAYKYNKLGFFDEFEKFEQTLDKYNIPYKIVNAKNCNDSKVINVLKKRKEKYFIFTGGGILKEGILNLKKKFIHVHPGIVPEFRGSTCIYYSILKEGKCGATAFFMTKKLDAGDVIAKKEFAQPINDNISNIDYEYDCHIRASLLIDIMYEYIKQGKFKYRSQKLTEGETYYIIHPVLKHLAILNCDKMTPFMKKLCWNCKKEGKTRIGKLVVKHPFHGKVSVCYKCYEVLNLE